VALLCFVSYQRGIFVAISLNDLLQANQQYAAGFTQGSLAMPPARKLAIVTCMDARVEPLSALGLKLGDTHVIRNAGGRVTPDALRSLAISERLLSTDAILVIHHTDCGMLTFSNDDIRGVIKRDLGDAAAADAAQIDFLPFSDLAESVRADLATIKASPLIPDSIPVYGLIYDVHSGRIEQVH
jgi:carbonic anhydrase